MIAADLIEFRVHGLELGAEVVLELGSLRLQCRRQQVVLDREHIRTQEDVFHLKFLSLPFSEKKINSRVLKK